MDGMEHTERKRILDAIAADEKELAVAAAMLKGITEQRLRLLAEEQGWQSEVESLRKLIEVRQNRLAPSATAQGIALEASAAEKNHVEIPVGPKVSVTGFIKDTINASGIAGITPPEIRRIAEKANIKMHPNYLYVALGKLDERKQITKTGDRYFKRG